ncbi:MAG: hypothetical protein ISR57_04510 [Bacteroidales bacterium]|nr:hypothetical protein [Bacteroidota bacterium]MBL6949889.1 hypothetical protein [Bacteroidales bacterium]
MRKLSVILLVSIFTAISLQAQDEGVKKPKFGIELSGFIKTDIFFDSRQVITARQGHWLLYPANEKLDADGKDINAKWNYNILSIQTRIAGSIWGPDVLGARSSAYVEGAFFGNINPAINTFRLRQAFIKLNWKTTELLTGQTWHPMFSLDCFPGTVSFNTGAPFVVFTRNPQIRLTQKLGKFKLQLAALSQVDFVSTGPDGPNTKYLRNSVLPELDLQLQFKTANNAMGTSIVIGAGIDFMMLTPRLATTVTTSPAYDTVINGIVEHVDAITQDYKTNTKTSAFAYNFYTKLKFRPITIKLAAQYGGNNYSFTMLGGYAVKRITDSAKGYVDYANVRSCAVWGEIHTNGKHWQTGIFGGFTKNLGAGVTLYDKNNDPTDPEYLMYVRGADIDYVWRVSPRLVYNIQKLRIAAEFEYTVAGYGTTTPKGYVSNPKAVGNVRALLAFFYFF